MLDTDTKRRIDTARDILVGKVPDPKSQVEQITIALIYKFILTQVSMMNGPKKVSHIFRSSELPYRFPKKGHERIRDYPTYTIPEAATMLGFSSRKLRYWTSNHPIWEISGAINKIPLLSFRDLAQAYVIETIRTKCGLSLIKARDILKEARKETRSRYPLLHASILIFFNKVLMDKREFKGPVVDLTQHRQLAIEQVVDMYATRVQKNSRGEIIRLFPWRSWNMGDSTAPVSIDPEIMSGRLVISGTRIMVHSLAQRVGNNENIEDLARDYSISPVIINQALRHLVPEKVA